MAQYNHSSKTKTCFKCSKRMNVEREMKLQNTQLRPFNCSKCEEKSRKANEIEKIAALISEINNIDSLTISLIADVIYEAGYRERK